MRHRIIEQRHSHRIPHRHPSASLRQQCPVLKRSHRIQPRFRRTIYKTAIDPRGHLVDLFARSIRTLAGVPIVRGPMERNVLVATTLRIVHFVAFLDIDAMHFDGAARLGGHHHLVGDQLAEERQDRCPIELRAEAIFAAHKESTQFSRRWPIVAGHRVHTVRIGGRCLAHQMTVWI